MKRIPHPIPYQGSKRRIARDILRYVPVSTRFVEPFAGSAAMALAAAEGSRASKFLIADLNGPLIDLWKLIIDSPEWIADRYEELWNAQIGRERDFYNEVRDQFNEIQRPDLFLYLLARAVKAAVRYNAEGEFNQSPDNRRRGVKPRTMRSHILGASRLLAGRTAVVMDDYRTVLENVSDRDLVYMDPPYQGVSKQRDSRYLAGLDFDEFVDSLAEINERSVAYIISYDGRTGSKQHGQLLPSSLHLRHLEIDAGVSAQATLNGASERTIESLYLSPALVGRLEMEGSPQEAELTLF